MSGAAGPPPAVEIHAVRATAHRIAALAPGTATVLAERDGWCLLDRDPRATGQATRTPAGTLRLDADGTLSVAIHGPDGHPAAPAALGLPGGADLLRRALTGTHSPRARLADACRAIGLPVALIEPPARPAAPAGPPPPVTGVVLVGAPLEAAAADAPLAGQSAWTLPLTTTWSLHLWDGEATATPVTDVAQVLADRRRSAVACWWSPAVAGFVLVREGRPDHGHQWGGSAPVTAASTAAAARALAEDFAVPDRALAVTALLRRTDLTPAAALAQLLQSLGLPDPGIGRSPGELTAWAAASPWGRHTPRPGMPARFGYAWKARRRRRFSPE